MRQTKRPPALLPCASSTGNHTNAAGRCGVSARVAPPPLASGSSAFGSAPPVVPRRTGCGPKPRTSSAMGASLSDRFSIV